MPTFSKETINFLVNSGGVLVDVIGKYIQPMPPSADRITPGDILIFDYVWGEQRVVLVVKSKKGDGVYPGKDDKLVSCFKLGASTDVVIDAILETLYNKRRLSAYIGQIKASLTALLGRGNYRTYKLGGMKQIYKVFLGN